jgi:hypothetical protein
LKETVMKPSKLFLCLASLGLIAMATAGRELLTAPAPPAEGMIDAAERFVCPCHGGVYDFQGKVTGGPPVRPLDRFVTRVRGGRVQVGPRFSVNSQLKRFSPRDPGEHLDGLWKYLYPKRISTPSPS